VTDDGGTLKFFSSPAPEAVQHESRGVR
jgi:hypothetical protein